MQESREAVAQTEIQVRELGALAHASGFDVALFKEQQLHLCDLYMCTEESSLLQVVMRLKSHLNTKDCIILIRSAPGLPVRFTRLAVITLWTMLPEFEIRICFFPHCVIKRIWAMRISLQVVRECFIHYGLKAKHMHYSDKTANKKGNVRSAAIKRFCSFLILTMYKIQSYDSIPRKEKQFPSIEASIDQSAMQSLERL